MEGNNYLIPANSKKSKLILGWFTPIDTIIFGTGIIITFVLILIINSNNIWVMLSIISPALATGLLVMPVPNYHNIRVLIKNIYKFFTTRRRYLWKGWSMYE
jgi:hypothetical protein